MLIKSTLTILLSTVCCFVVHAALPPSAELPRLQDMLNSMPMPTKAPVILKEPSPTVQLENQDEAERIRFTLKTLTINGVTVYEPQELLSIFHNMTGQETNVAELYKLANQITTKYRNDGYILARAIVPPQDVTSGHVSLQIIEGNINNVILVGDPDLQNSKKIQHYIQQLTQKGPAIAENLEHYLLLINDLPGVIAQSTLKPSEVSGASDLVVHLSREDMTADIGYNNWGTRYLGPNQIEGSMTFNNVLPALLDNDSFHDQLRVRAIQTTNLEELTYLDGTYILPIGNNGSTLETSMYSSISRPGLGLDALDTNNRSNGWSLSLKTPLKRTRQDSHYLSGTFDWKNSEVTSLGNTTSEDFLRVARIALNGTLADTYAGINNYKLEFSHGLPYFGASKTGDATSRQRGLSDRFIKAKLDLARLQRLNNSINVLFAGSGQFSTHALLAAEEFGVGGENYGRGYDNSEIIGDQGIALKTELQYNFEVGEKYIDQWQLFFFQDFGAIWNKDRGFGDEPGARTLASNGFGARVPIGESMMFDFTLANPRSRSVNSQGESGKNPTVFIRLKKRFSHNWAGS